MLEFAGIAFLLIMVGALFFALGRRGSRPETTEADGTRGVWTKVTRLERERSQAQEVIEGMREGVLVLNGTMIPVIANSAARRLLTLPGGNLPPRIPSDEVVSTARRALTGQEVIESDLNWTAAGLSLRVRCVPLADADGVVIFLNDITEELRTQQLRRQFVANASHELKTPVASLKALVEAIQRSVRDDPDTADRFSERLEVETARLSELIDDLMDLSRVEDPAAMRVEEVDLSEVTVSQTNEIRPAANDKDIALAIEIDEGLRMRGDRQQLELLVRNLLDNAIRYTGDGGRIALTLRRAGDIAILDVRDSGVGIPLQAQSRVFERFFRVDEDRARVSGGTGLGLSIVKNVAESHGGSVSVTSELDEGSLFSVTLPLVVGNGHS